MAPADKEITERGETGDALTLGAATEDDTSELDAEPPLQRGDRVGRYVITAPIGEGGMGVVYAAFDPELDRKVAIKLLRAAEPGAQGRLLREAQAMARIAHPNVVPVFDAGTFGARVFVAMELVPGVTLRRWLKEKPRGWSEVLAHFRAAGEGLAAAHDAGLVHRDFKPENVLLGEDRRVRVMDFGLAVRGGTAEETAPTPAAEPSPGADPTGRLSTRYTQAGRVMGTPMYMSPEHHLGHGPDARSDQFSFAAALYWALYRRRPFDPQRLLAAAVTAPSDAFASAASTEPRTSRGRSGLRARPLGLVVVEPPPREPRVPGWLRRIVVRALSFAPDERFPSMRALLDAMDRGQRRRRFAVASGLAAATALSVATAAVAGLLSSDTRCSGAEAHLAETWDAAQRQRLEAQFAGATDASIRPLFGPMRARLDGYASDWVQMHREACLAARVRGEQTEQQLASRMVCLDRSLKQLRAVVGLVPIHAASKELEGAVDAAQALPSLSRCADLAALADTRLPPDDPESRPKVEAVSRLLAETRVLDDSGNHQAATARAQEALSAARDLNHPPLLAEALDAAGWANMKAGDARVGEQHLTEAVFTAMRAGHDEEVAQSAARLVYGVGVTQRRFDEGHTWARLSRAALDRIGGRDVVEIDLLNNHGSLYLVQHRPELAQTPYEAAAALAERVLGPLHPKRAVALTGLGLVHMKRADPRAAEPVLRQALDMIEQVRGPHHPRAAYVHRSLANVHRQLQQWPQALDHAARAKEIWERAMGPTHSTAADAWETLAQIHEAQGKDDDCLQSARRAVTIREKALGRTSPALAPVLVLAGEAALRLDRPREALADFEHILELKAPSESYGAQGRYGIARALAALGVEAERSRALAEAAERALRNLGETAAAEEILQWRSTHPRRSRP